MKLDELWERLRKTDDWWPIKRLNGEKADVLYHWIGNHPGSRYAGIKRGDQLGAVAFVKINENEVAVWESSKGLLDELKDRNGLYSLHWSLIDTAFSYLDDAPKHADPDDEEYEIGDSFPTDTFTEREEKLNL